MLEGFFFCLFCYFCFSNTSVSSAEWNREAEREPKSSSAATLHKFWQNWSYQQLSLAQNGRLLFSGVQQTCVNLVGKVILLLGSKRHGVPWVNMSCYAICNRGCWGHQPRTMGEGALWSHILSRREKKQLKEFGSCYMIHLHRQIMIWSIGMLVRSDPR